MNALLTTSAVFSASPSCFAWNFGSFLDKVSGYLAHFTNLTTMAGILSKLGTSSKQQEKPEKEKCEKKGQVITLSKQDTNVSDERKIKKKKHQHQQHQTKDSSRNPADDSSSTDASSNASSVENGHALVRPPFATLATSKSIVSSRRSGADTSVAPSVRSHKPKSTGKSNTSKRSTRSKLSAVTTGNEGGGDSSRVAPVKGRDKPRATFNGEASLPYTRVKGDAASVGKKDCDNTREDVPTKEDQVTRGSFSDSDDDRTRGSGSVASIDFNDGYTYYAAGRLRKGGILGACESAFSNCVNQIAAEVVSEVDPNHDIRSFIDAEDKGKKLGDAFVGAVTDTVFAIEEIPDKVAEAMNKREKERLAAEKERESAMKKAKEEESAVFTTVFGTDLLGPQREVIVGKDGIMVLDFTSTPEVPSDDHVVIKVEVRLHRFHEELNLSFEAKPNTYSSIARTGLDSVLP